MSEKKYQKGFSLLELSMYFMIISFLVITIFKGKDLLQAYRVQSTIKEYQQYYASYKSFQAKYGYLPGDFPDATKIWPDLQSTTRSEFSGNGDGNGYIDNSYFKDPSNGLQFYTWFVEGVYAWGQLSREGLISGSYAGTPTDRCYDYIQAEGAPHCNEEGGSYSGRRNTGFFITTGIHAPAASLPSPLPSCDDTSSGDSAGVGCTGKSMWLARRFAYNDAAGKFNAPGAWGQSGNFLTIVNDFRYYGANMLHIFYPTQCESAKIIDVKIDDGKPFTGKVQSEFSCQKDRPIISGSTCEYSSCYTGQPSDWDYVDSDDTNVSLLTPLNFRISDDD